MKNKLMPLRANLAQLQPKHILIPIAIILAVIVGGRWICAQWSAQISTLDQAIEMRQLQLAKYTRIADSGTKYESVNRALKKLEVEINKQRLFNAAAESLSKARFQNLVKDLAAKNRIDIRSTKVISARKQGDVGLVNLRIDAKGEIDSIRDFLLDLQANQHYIFISDIEIRTINRREIRYYYLTAELVAIKNI